MLDQKLENLCARTDFCVSITIGPSSTCRIAKFETRALYFTYNSTMNESIRVLSIELLRGASFGKILPWFLLSSALHGSRYKNQYIYSEKEVSSACGIAQFETGAFHLQCT